jgi:RNA polymerase sigma factor (sigma-70 family)
MITEEHEQRFRQCLADHANIMWKVVRAFAVTRQDQEDLLQETALQLWRSLPTSRGEAKTSTWIYRVAFNTALVWKRNETRRHAKHESFINLIPRSDVQPTSRQRQIGQTALHRHTATAEAGRVARADAPRRLELPRDERGVVEKYFVSVIILSSAATNQIKARN